MASLGNESNGMTFMRSIDCWMKFTSQRPVISAETQIFRIKCGLNEMLSIICAANHVSHGLRKVCGGKKSNFQNYKNASEGTEVNNFYTSRRMGVSFDIGASSGLCVWILQPWYREKKPVKWNFDVRKFCVRILCGGIRFNQIGRCIDLPETNGKLSPIAESCS